MKNIEVILIYIAILLLGYWLYTVEQRQRRSEKQWEKATEIAKYFGSAEITCFRFFQGRDMKSGCVWALIQFDSRYDDIYTLPRHEKRYELDRFRGGTEKELVRHDQEVRKQLSLLPYQISTIDAEMTYDEYLNKVSAYMAKKYDL